MTTPASNPIPVALRNDGDALLIEWNDGMTHRLPWQLLREQCPCATCRAKRAEPAPVFPILTQAEAQPIRPTALKPVGNYAYAIAFSDGHTTGIYSLDFLRKLGEWFAK